MVENAELVHDGTSTPSSGITGHSDSIRRKALADAALELIWERIATAEPQEAAVLPIGWISAEEIAQEAGVSVDIFDQIANHPEGAPRASVSAFESFLIDTLLDTKLSGIPQGEPTALADHPTDLEETIRTGFADTSLDIEDEFRFRIALALSAFAQLRRDDIARLHDEVQAMCPVLMYTYGRQYRGSVTGYQQAMSIGGVIQGSWLQHIYGIDALKQTVQFRAAPESRLKEWSLSAIAVWAILQHLTEPATQGD